VSLYAISGFRANAVQRSSSSRSHEGIRKPPNDEADRRLRARQVEAKGAKEMIASAKTAPTVHNSLVYHVKLGALRRSRVYHDTNFETVSKIPGGMCSRAANPTSTEMRIMMIHSNFSDLRCDNTSKKNFALSAIKASWNHNSVPGVRHLRQNVARMRGADKPCLQLTGTCAPARIPLADSPTVSNSYQFSIQEHWLYSEHLFKIQTTTCDHHASQLFR